MAPPDAVQSAYALARQHCHQLKDAAVRRGDADGACLAHALAEVLAAVHRWNEEAVPGGNFGVLGVDRATSDILAALLKGLCAT